MARTTKMIVTVWLPPPGEGVAVGVAPVVWCAVVWCAVVWCAVVWCAVVWCAVVCCGVVCTVVWCGVVVCVVGSVGSPPENLMQATINQQMLTMSDCLLIGLR